MQAKLLSQIKIFNDRHCLPLTRYLFNHLSRKLNVFGYKQSNERLLMIAHIVPLIITVSLYDSHFPS